MSLLFTLFVLIGFILHCAARWPRGGLIHEFWAWLSWTIAAFIWAAPRLVSAG